MKYFVFPTPENAECKLQHDSGWSATAVHDTDSQGRAGKSFTIPSNTPDRNGAELTVSADKKVTVNLRGVLAFEANDRAYLLCDDFRLQDEKVCPDVPPPPSDEWPTHPLGILQKVQTDNNFNLASPIGCGMFTEAGCKALHEHHHPSWGHIRKNPGQNQFNGHAVDAIQLLVNTMDTSAGIYDIITNSESQDAEVAFNFSGPPNPELWYYPAAPYTPLQK